MPGKLILKIQNGRLIESLVDGVKGPNCLKATMPFLTAFGADPKDFDDKHTPEFDERVEIQEQREG